MLAQYQQCGCDPFEWHGKPECPEKNDCKLVRNRQNFVDVTKHRVGDIGLPDLMGVPKNKLPKGGGSTGTTFWGTVKTGSLFLNFMLSHLFIAAS